MIGGEGVFTGHGDDVVTSNSGYAVIEGVADPMVDGFLAGISVSQRGYKIRRELGSSQWIFVMTLSGAGFVHDGTGQQMLPPASAILIPPYVFHEYGVTQSEQTWELVWAHVVDGLIDPTILDWSGALHKVSVCHLDETGFGKAKSDLFECYELSRRPDPHDHRLASVLLSSVLARCRHQIAIERGKSDPRVETVNAIVAGALMQPNRVTDLAKAVNISPSRLTQLFHQELGMTPQDYVERERLARAARLLLQSDMTLAEVARSTGFANEFYFSRRFKMAHGVSPGKFRRSGGATIQ